jgi:hypothetical protein
VAENPSETGADAGSALALRIDTVEQAYEYMLAYAAQGLSGDAASQSGGQLRELLGRAVAALADIGVAIGQAGHAAELAAFRDVVERDAANAVAAMRLVLAQTAISSQLVDNLNASIHLRALLTDLFLLDEVLKTL